MKVRVSAAHLERFRRIQAAFPRNAGLPDSNAWKKLSDDDIWIRIFGQVTAVGGVGPAARLNEKGVRDRIAWSKLSLAKDPNDAKEAIWTVLREIGARYAGRDRESCRKTKALMQNTLCLKNYPGGPKGFIRKVAELAGGSHERIAFVARHFSYIKNKGARDILTTSFGLVRDHIALDSRVVGSLKLVGIRLPRGVTSDARLYAQVERDLIEQVCGPLKLTGAEFDQLLFVNYPQIKRMRFGRVASRTNR